MRQAVVIDAVRTPIGRAHAEQGIYRDVRADDLSADIMNALLARTGVPGKEIEDIQWGCVKQEAELLPLAGFVDAEQRENLLLHVHAMDTNASAAQL